MVDGGEFESRLLMDLQRNSINPVFQDLLEQLRDATQHLPDTHKRMLSLTGTAWSADRAVKVVVGPRGQLVDVEIDPRVFRRPNAGELRARILEASAAAVAELQEKTREIMDEQIPPEVEELRAQYQPDSEDPMADLLRTDAEIYAARKDER
jgi:hypothetical protein